MADLILRLCPLRNFNTLMARTKGGNVSCVAVFDINTNFLLLVIGLSSQLGIPTYMNPKFEIGSLTCLYFKILILWHVLTPSFWYNFATIRCDFHTILQRFTAISDCSQRLTAIFIQSGNDSLRFQTIFDDSLRFPTIFWQFSAILIQFGHEDFGPISDSSQLFTTIGTMFQ